MRKVFTLLLVFGFLLGFSQTIIDTAQIVIPNRVNAELTKSKPYVILISADGFRYDYLQKYNATNLLALAKDNVWAKEGMYPSYPSITFPNHYSIITGLYPSHHGIVDNTFYDPTRNEMYKIGSETLKDGSWYGGLPLWGLAENQGVLAASLLWVGSESNAGGTRPTYYYPYHEKFNGDDKARIVRNWLQIPEEKRPHFISLYFPEVDAAGHHFGPDSKETEEAVHFVDASIGKLINELKPLNLPINFVFVSDHGMMKIDQNYLAVPEIDRDKFVVVNSNTFVRITAKNEKDISELYVSLKKNASHDYKVVLDKRFPRKLKYSSREDQLRRIGDILLVPNAPKVFADAGKKVSIGKHGYNPYKTPEMKASFIAWGPAFEKQKMIKPFGNVNIYPMIAEILNLKITQPIDGNAKVLRKILNK